MGTSTWEANIPKAENKIKLLLVKKRYRIEEEIAKIENQTNESCIPAPICVSIAGSFLKNDAAFKEIYWYQNKVRTRKKPMTTKLGIIENKIRPIAGISARKNKNFAEKFKFLHL